MVFTVITVLQVNAHESSTAESRDAFLKSIAPYAAILPYNQHKARKIERRQIEADTAKVWMENNNTKIAIPISSNFSMA